MNREFWKRVWWHLGHRMDEFYPDDEPIQVTLAKIDILVKRIERKRELERAQAAYDQADQAYREAYK